MIEQMFMPLSRQTDEGFGAVGQVFQEAADSLQQIALTGGGRRLNAHLPINYLYRHAIELYLKSMIVIIHRRLRLLSDDGTYDQIPKIKVGSAYKQIYNVHGVRALFDEMRRLCVSNRKRISQIAKTDWSAIPDDLASSIATIDAIDPASTAFRYPRSRSPQVDEQKSSFKKIEFDELTKRMNREGKKQFALVVVEGEDNVVESFALDDDPIPGLREALVHAVETLGGAQFGIMMELGE